MKKITELLTAKHITIDGHSVSAIKNVKTGEFTLCLKFESGGPIISGKTLEEATEKFKEALMLSKAAKKLMNFKETGKFFTEENEKKKK